MILENNCIILNEYLTPDEVARIHKAAEVIPWDEGRTGGNMDDPDAPMEVEDSHGLNEDLRVSQVKWFERDNFIPKDINDKIINGLQIANQNADWNVSIDYFENYQYTQYTADRHKPGFYTWHTDHGGFKNKDGTIRKLSITIQLSDPDEYNGGHFQWLEPVNEFNQLTKEKVVDVHKMVCSAPFSAKAIGTMIVFPSFVYHQVTPVTMGTRKSLVGWACGQPYV
jgi:PKHD-type hydroxylase